MRCVSATCRICQVWGLLSPAGPFGDLQTFERGQTTCLCSCVSLVPVEMAPKEMGAILWAFCGLAQAAPEIVQG